MPLGLRLRSSNSDALWLLASPRKGLCSSWLHAQGSIPEAAARFNHQEFCGYLHRHPVLDAQRVSLEPYSKFLSSNFGRLLCLVAFAVVLLLPVNKGLKSLENRMDFRCMVPRNSPAIRGFDIVDLVSSPGRWKHRLILPFAWITGT